MQHTKPSTVQYNHRRMEPKPILAKTFTGQEYDVKWPADSHGGGSKPAIPAKKRGEFVGDVLGQTADGKPLTTTELRKKWGKLLTSDRTLFKWVAWARGLEPYKGAAA